MKHLITILTFTCIACTHCLAQEVSILDDFEGNTTINTWFGDNCEIDLDFDNPYKAGINTSERVMEYHDVGGQYANVRFQVDNPFDLKESPLFSIKLYVPSSGLVGEQTNQVSLKLQDGNQAAPWMTQTEIIKSIVLDQWQEVQFDFSNDNFINLDPTSLPPLERTDFNRLLIQVNGENNTSQVLAYIDDIGYGGEVEPDPEFLDLVWSDEFDADGPLDEDKWFHQTKIPNGQSWFNGEIQHYTDKDDNTYIKDGLMYLVAKKESYTNQGVTKQYTSARLNSKFAFKEGRVEVRAKLPEGVGTWPAIWMLGKNITENGAYWQTQGFGTTGWPQCGEIDIMEHWGTNQNYVQSAMHTPSSFGATVNHGGQFIETASTDFHTYELVWTEEKMKFSVDGVTHYTYNPDIKNSDTWPYTSEQYLLLNIAIQSQIDPNFTESAMVLDYVRVYQQGGVSSANPTQLQSIKYYPNPLESQLFIEFEHGFEGSIDFDIFSLDGNLAASQQARLIDNTVTLDKFGDLASGQYYVVFKIDNRPYTIRVVKS